MGAPATSEGKEGECRSRSTSLEKGGTEGSGLRSRGRAGKRRGVGLMLMQSDEGEGKKTDISWQREKGRCAVATVRNQNQKELRQAIKGGRPVFQA